MDYEFKFLTMVVISIIVGLVQSAITGKYVAGSVVSLVIMFLATFLG